MTVRRGKGFDLVEERASSLIPPSATLDVSPHNQALARRCVERLAAEWAQANRRTHERRRFNALLVQSVLGLATEEEENEVLWRMWLRPGRGLFSAPAPFGAQAPPSRRRRAAL